MPKLYTDQIKSNIIIIRLYKNDYIYIDIIYNIIHDAKNSIINSIKLYIFDSPKLHNYGDKIKCYSNNNDKYILMNKYNLTTREQFYFDMINKFFSNLSKKNIEKIINIIDGKSYISLRVLDWFVTKYANKYKVCINNAKLHMFDVHIGYKSQLKSFKKKYFDPFRRQNKFYYHYDIYDELKCTYTTLGQLNFFKWAHEYNIIDYIEDNYNLIMNAMYVFNNISSIDKNNYNAMNSIINNINDKINNNLHINLNLD